MHNHLRIDFLLLIKAKQAGLKSMLQITLHLDEPKEMQAAYSCLLRNDDDGFKVAPRGKTESVSKTKEHSGLSFQHLLLVATVFIFAEANFTSE